MGQLLTLVTRNVRDIERTGVQLLDPFSLGAVRRATAAPSAYARPASGAWSEGAPQELAMPSLVAVSAGSASGQMVRGAALRRCDGAVGPLRRAGGTRWTRDSLRGYAG